MNLGILLITILTSNCFHSNLSHLIWHKNKRLFITIKCLKRNYIIVWYDVIYQLQILKYNWCFFVGWMYEIKAEWVHQQTYTTVRKKIAFAGGETVIFYTLTPPRPKVLHFHKVRQPQKTNCLKIIIAFQFLKSCTQCSPYKVI